jgi:hypothetical protein
MALSGHRDGTIRAWRVDTGTPIAVFVPSRDKDWLVLTAGKFFASSDESWSKLTIVRGLEVYSIVPVARLLNRPDIVKEILGGDPQNKVDESAAGIDLNEAISPNVRPDPLSIMADQ